MHIYKVRIEHNYHNYVNLIVVARSPRGVIESVEKLAKKKYWSTLIFHEIMLDSKVDVFQK